LTEFGFCPGIENYSRHLDGRRPGQPPATLMSYYPGDYLIFIDESHVTVPQLGGMYWGDRSRKETLVGYGFRLPSALDNRPLSFEEFEMLSDKVIYVSATPGRYEREKTEGRLVEQIIRPTGLVDPRITVMPASNQVDDLIAEIRETLRRGWRVLVTTLTKRSAEDLAEYLEGLGIKVRYLHSDIDTLARVEILSELRRGVFDVLVGINLLREGLDLPEVELVAVLDADKEGFLRSVTSIIQTCGRAARNIGGRVILYADTETGSIASAVAETSRRRKIQLAYNKKHGITPKTVEKALRDIIGQTCEADYVTVPEKEAWPPDIGDVRNKIKRVREEMMDAASRYEYEKAAELRDEMFELQQMELELR
jgi:excinuclease ABC subunit B